MVWVLIGNIKGQDGVGGDGALIGEIIGLAANAPVPAENFVRCDGGFVNDVRSPMNGMPIPDLNNQNRFLRGNIVAGDMGGSKDHSHQNLPPEQIVQAGAGASVTGDVSLNLANNEPLYYDTVFYMRIW